MSGEAKFESRTIRGNTGSLSTSIRAGGRAFDHASYTLVHTIYIYVFAVPMTMAAPSEGSEA
jgi:hypothetical protein